MTNDGCPCDLRGRQKRFLTAQEKYEVFMQLSAGRPPWQRWRGSGGGPSTIVRIREVGKQAALEALANAHPGWHDRARPPSSPRPGPRSPACPEALKEMAIKVTLLEGKGPRWG